ncbi:DUF2510 domain-containing protein [Streptomyces sp. NPDC001068]|uniref:DUF2510 domain-containing protein n=1 Tax=Streptomyces sp. NPDC001068 TaxID=3364544 RepID=UPI0036B1B680
MTQVTPPGWYPDPGQTSDGPASERWWDGKAWTERTRPAGSGADWGPPTHPPASPDPASPRPEDTADPAGTADPADAARQTHPGYPAYPGPAGYQGPPGYQGYPGYPGYPAPPATGRRGLRTGVAVGIAVAVLAAIGVGAWALTADGDGGGQASQRNPGGQSGGSGQGGPEGQNGGQGFPFGGSGGSGSGGSDSGGSGDGGSPAPGQSEAPKVQGGGTVSDSVNAIGIPVPKGWTGQVINVGAQITSDDSYKCPGDTSQSCTTGGAYSAPALALGTKGDTAEEVAKADISANASESYGGKTYGSITSHEVLASKAVTVAGQKGYLVRWKAVTSKGSDGYVESLAFPSPSNARQIVVVRFGVDVGQKQSVIDEITQGIRVSSGGGDGQTV